MAPITQTEVAAESALQKAQAHHDAVIAHNLKQWSEVQEYFKSLPEHHQKAHGRPASEDFQVRKD